jgi:uncharacterized SAM-binding protein YcdF (DUF218 family)
MIQFLKSLRPADPVLMLALFAIGALWVAMRPSSKWPRRYLLAVIAGYWFASTPLGAGLLLRGLGTGLPRVESREAAGGADVVVVLGGGAQSFRVGGLVATALNGTSLLRAMEGARVFKAIGARLVIASAGIPDGSRLLQPERVALTQVMIAAGVPATAIVQESGSKTTRDQAVLVGPILRAHDVRRFVLVTSPSHMRRALAVFRAEGFDPVPSVSPLRSEHRAPPPMLVPSADVLSLTDQAVYEYAATIYYWWSGWLRAPAQ